MTRDMKIVKVKGFEDTIVYNLDGWFVIKLEDLPEEEHDPLRRFMAGQTMPYVPGGTYIYLHDYENFLHKSRTGQELFWD
jgi:hypothetical protein